MRVEVRDGGRACCLGARRFAGQIDLLLDLGKREWNRVRVAVAGQCVDPRSSGVAESEQLRDLVIGLSGCVVQGAAHQ